MAQYQLNQSPQTHGAHRLVIGIPLVLIAFFCFSFSMMRANSLTHPAPALTPNVGHSHATQTTLPTVSLTPKAGLVVLSTDSSNSTVIASGVITASPSGPTSTPQTGQNSFSALQNANQKYDSGHSDLKSPSNIKHAAPLSQR